VFRIEMLPAGHGDSLLITYGAPPTPHLVLIDGGPYYTYNGKTISERAALTNRVRQLIDAGQSLELLVITHVDGDHIEGVVKLLGDWPSGLEIGGVWFNAWRHLAPDPGDLLGPIQGEMLSALIQRRKLAWNAEFGGKAVAMHSHEPFRPMFLSGGLQLTLLSPTPAKLADLRTTWQAEVTKAGLNPDAPDEALKRLITDRRLKPTQPEDLLGDNKPDIVQLAGASFSGDKSDANGTSIAFIAEFEGHRCLFAGDAHPTVLESSIRRLLDERHDSQLTLDAFKVPHHGSQNNLSRELLELLDCPRYLISTNGDVFHHPDQEAIARIVRYGGAHPTLYFNYRSDENKIWDEADLKANYRYEAVFGTGSGVGLALDL
jgi:hypothetical protein